MRRIAPEIHFGTAGWRGVIGRDFTFATVRQFAYTISRWWPGEWPRKVVIGYDTRFLSERFAMEAVSVLARYHFEVYLTQRDTPQPTLAWFTRTHGIPLGMNFTGSHNPPQFNGVKLIDKDGAIFPDELTQQIEEAYRSFNSHHIIAFTYSMEHVNYFDPKEEYLEALKELLDLDVLNTPLKVAVDPIFGTSREYIDGFLSQFPEIQIELLNSFKDPYFGGYSLDVRVEYLRDLQRFVPRKGFDLGLATDADGDRFGVVDRDGSYIPPDDILPVMYHYLLEYRKRKGGVVRNIATTRMLDRIAHRYGMPVIETKIGFKHMRPYLWQPDILIAVEESSGFAMNPHIPDKDGILAALLVTEIVARTGMSLQEYKQKIEQEFGKLYQVKRSCMCTPDILEYFQELVSFVPSEFAGMPVKKASTLDGLYLEFDDDTWLLIRRSGTEPLIRFYSESPDPEKSNHLIRNVFPPGIGEPS